LNKLEITPPSNSNHFRDSTCFLRKGRTPGDIAVVVCNFTPAVRHSYRSASPGAASYGAAEHRLAGVGNAGAVMAAAIPCHGRPFSLDLTLPPLATLVLVPQSGR
jgi:1,4-alpha-glucan branching enzyme